MSGNLIDAQSVRAEMERVLASPRFETSERQGRFLRCLVENSIQGGPPLEEDSIAADVFGRSANFVAALDPVVRIEFRRLRAALAAYYRTEGSGSSLVLQCLDRGYGVAVADRRTIRPPRRWGRMAAVVAALAVCGLVAFHFRPGKAGARAVTLVQQARDLRAKRTLANAGRSQSLLEQAVQLDPDYALAWSNLADALLFSGTPGELTKAEAISRASDAANEAVRLDPSIGAAHADLAYIRFFRDSDWAGAEPEYRKAIELDPSSPKVHSLYAQGLVSRGRFDEALAQARLAASLTRAGGPPSTDLAEILIAARRHDEAIAEARRVVQESGGAPFAHTALGMALAGAGHYDEAIVEYQSAILTGHSLYALARLGSAYGAKGDAVAAQSALAQLDRAFNRAVSVEWSYRALVYAGMGDAKNAVACLRKSLANQEGDVNFIGVDAAYDRIRSDAGFVALRKELELP